MPQRWVCRLQSYCKTVTDRRTWLIEGFSTPWPRASPKIRYDWKRVQHVSPRASPSFLCGAWIHSQSRWWPQELSSSRRNLADRGMAVKAMWGYDCGCNGKVHYSERCMRTRPHQGFHSCDEPSYGMTSTECPQQDFLSKSWCCHNIRVVNLQCWT